MRYENMPVCDLRHLNDVTSIKEIEGIENVALVLYPENASPEIKSAISTIPSKNVACPLWLHNDGQLRMFNGTTEITDSMCVYSAHDVLVINGPAFIKELHSNIEANIVLNGPLIVHESHKNLGLKLLVSNGKTRYVDFENIIFLEGEQTLDLATLQILERKTMIVIVGKTVLKDDITIEILSNKKPIIYAIGQLECRPEIVPYIKVHGFIDGKLEVLQNSANE